MRSSKSQPGSHDLNVVAMMLEDPIAWHYGLALGKAAGIAAGTVYPVLARLEKSGWLDSRWERGERHGAPRRRLYRLTGVGQRAGDAALAEQPEHGPSRTRRRFGFGLPQPLGERG